MAGSEQDGIEESMSLTKIAPIAVSCARILSFLLLLSALAAISPAQTCLTSEDMDVGTRTSLQNTAKQYFDLAAKGDVASLRQNAIPSVAADFGGIEAAVRDHQETFAGAQATPRGPFQLTVEGNKPLERAEFLCG